MSESSPETPAESAARLAAIRAARTRAADEPNVADRARYQGRSGLLKQAMVRRADPTVKTLLDEYARRHKAQARVLGAAGPAVFRALTRELSALVCPVSFMRGTLTLAVPDESIRFKLDRQLRGGGRASIQADLPKVDKIVIAIDLEPFKVVELPRQEASAADVERDRWEEIDQGVQVSEGRGYRCAECDWEFLIRIRGGGGGADQPGVLRLARAACPNCATVGLYHVV